MLMLLTYKYTYIHCAGLAAFSEINSKGGVIFDKGNNQHYTTLDFKNTGDV